MRNDRAIINDVLNKKRLTNRQRDVTFLIIRGFTNLETANALGMSEKTVKFHLTEIFKKFKVRTKVTILHACYRAIIDELRA